MHSGLKTTYFSPSGKKLRVGTPKADRPAKIDCFYVYPTVSDQPTAFATRAIDPEIRSIALYQAARYSQHCRVFAPVYRQATVAGLGGIRRDLRRGASAPTTTCAAPGARTCGSSTRAAAW